VTHSRRKSGRVLAWTILVAYLFFVVLPFGFTFLTSLKPTNEVTRSPVIYFSENANLSSYYTVLFERDYGQYLVNTLIISLSVVFLAAIFGIPAAYAMARYRFPFKAPLMAATISIRLIPPISLIVPFFLFMRVLNAIDTIYALILVNFMLNLPFFIWIAWGFFKDLPWELEEAALLDGATRLESLVKVMIPIAAPGLGAAAIVAFLFTWNEYLFALTFSQSAASKTISVGISDFVGDVFVRWNLISAAGILTIIPAIIFVFVFQKYIVQGLSAGSVKG
jgi:multiple sugar transport system permease protein